MSTGDLILAGAAVLAGYRGVKMADAAIDKDHQIDVLARTLWGEARGEGYSGMQAVANVVMNRVKRGGWYGLTPAEVCKKPYQFSCWIKSDPNYLKLINVTTSDRLFKQAKDIATLAVNGQLADITGGATEYHTKAVKPKWNYEKLQKTASIGQHIFYKSAIA